MWLGDLIDGGTHHFYFTTVGADGLPATLGGSPVLSCYKDANTTQTTTGPAITADFDGVTGLNVCTLTLTDAFYVADTDYAVVITTGTIGGSSVAGYVVANFSISNRMPNVNVEQWLDTTVATPTVGGVPEVDITHQGGGAIPAPAVTGVPDVNVTHLEDSTTVTLPGQSAPPLAPTLPQLFGWLYKVLRNRKDQTATLWQLYADNETTVDAKATVSDDGTTAIKQEIVSGP